MPGIIKLRKKRVRCTPQLSQMIYGKYVANETPLPCIYCWINYLFPCLKLSFNNHSTQLFIIVSYTVMLLIKVNSLPYIEAAILFDTLFGYLCTPAPDPLHRSPLIYSFNFDEPDVKLKLDTEIFCWASFTNNIF